MGLLHPFKFHREGLIAHRTPQVSRATHFTPSYFTFTPQLYKLLGGSWDSLEIPGWGVGNIQTRGSGVEWTGEFEAQMTIGPSRQAVASLISWKQLHDDSVSSRNHGRYSVAHEHRMVQAESQLGVREAINVWLLTHRQDSRRWWPIWPEGLLLRSGIKKGKEEKNNDNNNKAWKRDRRRNGTRIQQANLRL